MNILSHLRYPTNKKNMKNPFSFNKTSLLLLFALLFVVSCGQDSESEEVFNQGFSGYAKNLAIYTGRNRIKLVFEVKGDSIDHFVVNWDHGHKNRTISVEEANDGVIHTIIDELTENNHSFEVLAYNGKDVTTQVPFS